MSDPRPIAAALLAAAGLCVPALAADGTPHDGTWSVRMVTDQGLCDASYSYAIAVDDGGVRYIPKAGDGPATVSGRIGADGAVALDIRRSLARVDASGRLAGGSGAGTWRLAMLGCSGRWTAQKRTTTVSN